MGNDSALHILLSIIIAVMFLAAGLTGRPGSILGALIDADHMHEQGDF